jgi:transposase-like protein
MRQLKAELWTKWRELISEQSQSGQTVKAFCLERGLRDSLFYDWKKRLREGQAAKFVEVKVKGPCKQASPAPGHGAAIELRLSKERSLLVEPGFDANHLRTLLAVLETEV